MGPARGAVNPLPGRDIRGLVCLPEIAENKGRILQVFDFETKDIHGSHILFVWLENPQTEYNEQKTPSVKSFGYD